MCEGPEIGIVAEEHSSKVLSRAGHYLLCCTLVVNKGVAVCLYGPFKLSAVTCKRLTGLNNKAAAPTETLTSTRGLSHVEKQQTRGHLALQEVMQTHVKQKEVRSVQ